MPAVSVFPAYYPFFQPHQSATIANTVVAVDCPAALRAFPFLLLLEKKSGDALVPDIFQVFDEARPEIGDVTLVDVAEPVAWEIRAFVAIFHFPVQE